MLNTEREVPEGLLPPIEDELMGCSSWQEIEALSRGYQDRLTGVKGIGNLVQTCVSYGIPPWEYQGLIQQRVRELQYWADIGHAREIFDDPHATEEELKFARSTSWLYQVNALINAWLPSPPDGRARIADGVSGDTPEVDPEAISEYDRLYPQYLRMIQQKVLNDTPDPHGRVRSVSEFLAMDSTAA